MFLDFKIPKELIPEDPRFGCGPSRVPVEHIRALLQSGTSLIGTSHRGPAVKKLMAELMEGLVDYFNVPDGYQVILGNGGASMLFDMLPLSLVESKVAHFVNGVFSERWCSVSAAMPFLKVKKIALEYGKGIDIYDCPDQQALCATLNETSTGAQLSEIPAIEEGQKLLMIDATSGAGQIPCDLSRTDVFFFAPQKVMASEGGMWVAIISPKAIELANKLSNRKDVYIPQFFSIPKYVENAKKHETYTTPSITTLFLLNEQLKKLNALGGLEEVILQGEKKAQLVYNWAKAKPYLAPFIKEECYQSKTTAAIQVDQKIDVSSLILQLTQRNWVNGILKYRKIKGNQLRLAMYPSISYEDLEKLTGLLSMIIERNLDDNIRKD